MTSISVPLSSPVLPCRPVTPTTVDRLLLRIAHAAETYAVRRMSRRSVGYVSPADALAEKRRTAQALASLGIVPL